MPIVTISTTTIMGPSRIQCLRCSVGDGGVCGGTRTSYGIVVRVSSLGTEFGKTGQAGEAGYRSKEIGCDKLHLNPLSDFHNSYKKVSTGA